MDLKDLNAPLPKPWLKLKTNTLDAVDMKSQTAELDEVRSNLVVLNNQVGVPNAPLLATTFFSSGQGNLSQTDDLGATVTYATSASLANAVLSNLNPSIAGNFPAYVDTTGLLIQDSGVGVPFFINLVSGLAGLANVAKSVAPEGQNALWQVPSPSLGFNGGFLTYIESTNTLYSSDWSNAVPGTHYSLNGGLTWAPCVFNVVPSVAMMIAYNGAGLWVAIANSSAVDFSYTSVDGVNFTSTGTVTALNNSINFLFNTVSNLFVSGITTDATHWISTSPDGIIWTPRLTSDYTGLANYLELGQRNDGSVMVLVGDSQVQPAYSLDGGLTWTLGTGSPSSKQAIAWSETKQEFLAMGVTANVIRSSDGKVWEDVGNGGFGGCVSVIWVDFPIARYYAAYGSPDGFYNMASTLDSHLPFAQTHLDGSTVLTQAYGFVVYIQQYDRFLLAVDSNSGVAYSTARPALLKAMNNGMSVYPQFGAIPNGAIITNTAIETSLLPVGAGSLIIPANSMPLGSVTKFRASIFLANAVALDTLVIRLRGNGSQLWQSPILTGPLVNTVLILEIELQNVDNANPIISAKFYRDGVVPVLISTGVALNYAINDTFDLTAQWSAANVANQVQLNSFNMHLLKF